VVCCAATAAELLTTVGALGSLVVSVEKKVVMSELLLIKDNSKAGRWEILYFCSWSRLCLSERSLPDYDILGLGSL
jgi:hypothetical protein